MRKFTFLIGVLLLSISGLVAQVPGAFKYQAIIRDNRGEPIANKEVSLQIILSQEQKDANSVYTEVHQTKSNEYGLVNLEIGRGKVTNGNFDKIKWSSGSYYIHVAMDLQGKGEYSSIGSSQLLSVPYALQARDVENGFSGEYKDLKGKPTNVSEFQNDAGYITGAELEEIDRGGAPVPTVDMIWNTKGNLGINPFVNKFGTLDSADVVMVTKNQERMRMLASGSITINNALKVGQGFQVNGSVILNENFGGTVVKGPFTVDRNSPSILTGSLRVDGATTLNSSLTVANMAPTVLTGTLRVDKETDLNARLRVNNMASTILTGSLQVDKITDLNSNLNVNNAAPTVLTGTLRTDLNATFKQMVSIDNPTLGSSSFNTGALVVAGGVGIGQNLNVAGNSTFGGNANFLGIVNFSNTTQSTANNNGAVVIGGGLGLAKNLNMGGDFNINTNRFNVNGANGNTLIAGTLGVTGATSLNNTLSVIGATTLNSTLGVTGTTTIGGSTTINNTLAANGQVTINASLSGGDASYGAYPLRVQGSDQGIAVKVNGTRGNSKNFVSFIDDAGTQGRIEGQTLNELQTSFPYIWSNAMAAAEEAFSIAMVVACGLSVPPDVAEAIVWGVEGLLTLAEWIEYNVSITGNVGVAYESGSGDYAEWLERSNPLEDYSYGEIVGVRGGKINRLTRGADHVMVVSKAPIVLGNMPDPKHEDDYEKVAFMGQVPVRVMGKVAVGDYILPSGFNDGFGRAVAPNKMKLEDYSQIVGVAWQSGDAAPMNLVNVAVGINNNDLAGQISKQQNEIDQMKQQLNQVFELLGQKSPYNEQERPLESVVTSTNVIESQANKNNQSKIEFSTLVQEHPEILIDAFAKAKIKLLNNGVDVNKYTEISKIFDQPIAWINEMNQKGYLDDMIIRAKLQVDNKFQVGK